MQDLVISKNGKDWKLLSGIDKIEGAWITAEELGKHLGYSEPRKAVIKIYERFSENFENKRDSAVVKLTTAQKAISGLPSNRKQTQNTRIFSERGALKIIRHSETPEADKIMDCVFDVFLEANRKEQLAREFVNKLLIEKMILPAPRNWTKAFPDSFGEAVFRLYNLGEYKPGISSLPFSRFVSLYIYGAAPTGIYEKLLEKNPVGANGDREFKHHQFLEDEAKNWLLRQLSEVTTLIRCSRYNITIFKQLFETAFPKVKVDELEHIMLSNTQIDIKQLLFDF